MRLLYLAIGFPPAAKSSAYRMRATANLFVEAGWDVTVLTIRRTAWLREYGLDPTLEEGVDPRVDVVELPLARVDLEPDIRRYSWLRARFPQRWLSWQRRREQLAFPEPVFGSWRRALQREATAIHLRTPVDLALVSPAPYVQLAAAHHLRRRHGVPYVVDFRDGWSIDVLGGGEAFPAASRRGRWERRVLADAELVWTVNDPIKGFYADRYPALADRLRVVRNGFDPDAVTPVDPAAPADEGLTFGYLGTVNITAQQLAEIVEGWKLARATDPAMAGSRLVFRGHMGAGHARSANAQARVVHANRGAGVSYGGPVAKSDVAAVYGSFDALVLALAGGRYVTSGKVYEYMATGLPIVSVHEYEHAAAEVLDGYPLWARAAGADRESVAVAFVAAARQARTATPADHDRARSHALTYERRRLLAPAIHEVIAIATRTVSA